MSEKDILERHGYEFVSYHEVLKPQPNGTEKDESYLIAKNRETGEVETLRPRDVFHMNRWEVVLAYTSRGVVEEHVRGVNQVFVLWPEPAVKYRITKLEHDYLEMTRVVDGAKFTLKFSRE